MKQFYMMVGFPGSGKTSYASNVILNNANTSFSLICRDELVCKYRQIMSRNKANETVHSFIVDKLKTMNEDIVIYDSVNADSLGRKFFLELIDTTSYNINIVYFKPHNLINECN